MLFVDRALDGMLALLRGLEMTWQTETLIFPAPTRPLRFSITV